MGNKIFVGNLSFNTTEGTLMDLFSQAGEVSEVVIVLDPATNRSRGFGFVTMSSDDDAGKAIAMYDGKDVDGRRIIVNEASPQERPRGGFGGRTGF